LQDRIHKHNVVDKQRRTELSDLRQQLSTMKEQLEAVKNANAHLEKMLEQTETDSQRQVGRMTKQLIAAQRTESEWRQEAANSKKERREIETKLTASRRETTSMELEMLGAQNVLEAEFKHGHYLFKQKTEIQAWATELARTVQATNRDLESHGLRAIEFPKSHWTAFLVQPNVASESEAEDETTP